MKLVKILPDKIQIRTDDAEFANARLNDLISVSDGEAELVTMITAITDNDAETQMDDNAIMEELQQPSLKVIECSIPLHSTMFLFKCCRINFPNILTLLYIPLCFYLNTKVIFVSYILLCLYIPLCFYLNCMETQEHH